MAEPVDIAPRHDRELVIAHLMDATPEQLFKAWTTPELYPEWFCPKPWRAEVSHMDLRPGGGSQMMMYGPDGESFPNGGVYLEIDPGRKLVFTDAFSEGWIPNPDAMMTAVLTFEPQADGRTLYTARVGHPSLEKKADHEARGFHDGWGVVAQQLEALAKTL
ncbi:SRPBCC family protein [Phenylobacterium aquaticum]|jgi:uncharacterized protein YndB with AHSA1/START domain|uniref:SRPBCC family protein n=1 Tax=Phenylobacterium aquaticum TaxID=1763816 RepID=UPI001F5D3808|nr:SRPBCC family protein [Phenylobacterium aquaticum]MCI3132351.1 SRPBCC family protein [Phenylobacterium aquaticum]